MRDIGGWLEEDRLRGPLGRVAGSPAVTLALAALVLFGASWRVDVFIVDTVAVANALANLADGSVSFAQVYFGPADAATPGVYVTDGRLYGRNYGQVVAALPVLSLLEAVSTVAAPRLLLAGAWSLCLAALGGRLADHLGRPWLRTAAIVLSTFALVANAAFATALPPRLFPLVALQAVTVLAAAGLVASSYLLVCLLYDRRTGVAAGVGTLLLGPVGFWATIPKRHVITGFLVVLTAYLFARSRSSGRVRDRAVTYVPVGLTAWVSAPEGLLLLVALVPVDLATSPRNDLRALAPTAATLAVSLAPFLLTNVIVAGNPLVPPRLLAAHATGDPLAVDPGLAASHPSAVAGADGAGATGGTQPSAPAPSPGSESAAGSGSGSTPSPSPLTAAVSLLTGTATTGVDLSFRAAARVEQGVTSLSPDRLYHVVLRSGRIPGVDYAETGGETIDLALLESAPLLATLLAAPVLWLRRFRGRLAAKLPETDDPRRATDLFALVFVVVFTLPHLPRLPIHSTVTVRYLVPVVPLLAYGVFRLAPVRRVVRQAPRRLVVTTLLGAGVGGVAWATIYAALGPDVGTLMQAHALLNLAAAAVTALWLVVRPGNDRLGAVVLGLTAAAMALFLVFTGFEYFAADRQYLLPVARLAEQLLPILP
jgi:hypothetical protein